MEVAAHVDVCHDYCAASEHDVRFAIDLGFTGDLVARVLERFVDKFLFFSPHNASMRLCEGGFFDRKTRQF